jgi:hypothetical protein
MSKKEKVAKKSRLITDSDIKDAEEHFVELVGQDENLANDVAGEFYTQSQKKNSTYISRHLTKEHRRL